MRRKHRPLTLPWNITYDHARMDVLPWGSEELVFVRPSRSASARSFSTLRLNHQSSAACSRNFCYIPSIAIGLLPNISRFTLLHADGVHYQESVRWHSACNILLSTMQYVKRKKIQSSDSNYVQTDILSELVNISYLHAERARVMRAILVSRDVTMRQEP